MLRKIKKVILPFKDAIAASALQNFNKDVRNKKICKEQWNEVENEYKSEARVLLLKNKENNIPENPDFEHFCVK